MKDPNLYSTVDLGIATFLFTTGHHLEGVELLTPTRLLFKFKRKADTDLCVTRYLSGEAEAPAKPLFDNYRALRALAFERTGNLR